MWQQQYTPIAESLPVSALVAAIPIFVLLILLGVLRKPAWIAALSGLVAAVAVAVVAYGMPLDRVVGAMTYGAATGLFPIGWVVFAAILLYRLTVETGKFEVIKDSVGSLTDDRRLQALLIAFAFGAFIEGAAGFGTPVAVAAAMLTGLGFSPFYAASICMLANTAPVAFGSIGTPVLTLARITSLPLDKLSASVGRICAPVSLIVPAYLILVMGGWKALRGVLPAAILCGVSFAGTQFYVSNYVGPLLTDILSSLASIGTLVVLFKVWKPKDEFQLEGHGPTPKHDRHHTTGELLLAWGPYLLLVVLVLIWSQPEMQKQLKTVSINFDWPGLHNQIARTPPVTKTVSPYAAQFPFDWLSATGTVCLIASVLSAVLLRMPAVSFVKLFGKTVKQLVAPELTIATVMALAYLMNYSGATSTLGLAFAATGPTFPFFSALLGWLGVFLTGSDTSANALFGNLQVVTAGKLDLNPILMAASNSSGGVMGKMVSLSSIAVAAAATGMQASDEARLFRSNMRHSVILASVLGLVTVFYAYVMPEWAP